jgi:membrane fusion protein (multidrug efflux system)
MSEDHRPRGHHRSEHHEDDQHRGRDGKAQGNHGKQQGWSHKPALIGLLVLAVMGVVVGGVLIWRHTRSHASTDDAFIDVVAEQASAQVAGRVTQVLVDDNQDVKAGQVIVEIDPADFQSRLDQAEATQAQAEAQQAQAQAQKAVDQAQLMEARASLAKAEGDATNANNQLARYRALKAVNASAVSAQQLDSMTATATTANAQVESAQQSIAAAQAQIGYADSLIKAAQAAIGSAAAQSRQAQLMLSYTRVKARVDGRVASKTVSAGNVIAAGSPLMAIVPHDVYITANFKETQLAHLRRGQAVDITVDSYPDLKLTGKVDSVQPATGQAFSVLPAQNATGNWVKIVQRVPVKIIFDHLPDDPDRRLSPGMSVEVAVAIR